MKTASKKAKGSRLEKWVKKFFEDFGFPSRKQPGSGIYSDFPHDNCIELPGVGRVIIECKNWKHGWRTGDKAMGSADMLVIKRDFGEPCFYIPERTMAAICKALAQAGTPPWVAETAAEQPVPEQSKQISKKGFV